MANIPINPDGVEIRIALDGVAPEVNDVLSPAALNFVAFLQREFANQRSRVLSARAERQTRINAGENLGFLSATHNVRSASWTVASAPKDLRDRRVEITGPTDAKMLINALNSEANVHMSDFEDSNSPTFANMVQGQANLSQAVDGRLTFTNPDGREYRIAPEPAVLVVRPRGWHLIEKHVYIDGAPISASIFDFGLYFFHCARRLLEKGSGPYFYLPKLESHLEARFWNDIFQAAQDTLNIPRGSVRATVLVETIPAAFEMDEILYELRDHSSGLNAGRWDYMFSIIKTFHQRGEHYLLPDRNTVTMTAPFMKAYTDLLVHTCHRRAAHAIGGMAAFIPSRHNPEVNKDALAKVAKDKAREAADGFDGSWVAHPDLVKVCREQFDAVLGQSENQIDRLRDDVKVTAADLINISATPGHITEEGLHNNVNVGLQYLASWLDGQGAVGIFNLMEDAATAEIARSQVWQWIHNRAQMSDGVVITSDLVRRILREETQALGDPDHYERARSLFEDVTLSEDFVEFLTLPAYEFLP